MREILGNFSSIAILERSLMFSTTPHYLYLSYHIVSYLIVSESDSTANTKFPSYIFCESSSFSFLGSRLLVCLIHMPMPMYHRQACLDMYIPTVILTSLHTYFDEMILLIMSQCNVCGRYTLCTQFYYTLYGSLHFSTIYSIRC